MAYFPLFINIEDKPVLIIGGGKIAERRICSLLEFGCRVSVIAPEATEKLEKLAAEGTILWRKERYHLEHLTGELSTSAITDGGRPLFVLAAAVESVNGEVVRDCKALRIPVNNASKKEDCDFYFPGLIKEQEMVIGLTSGGSDHKAVAALSKKIRELVQKTWQV